MTVLPRAHALESRHLIALGDEVVLGKVIEFLDTEATLNLDRRFIDTSRSPRVPEGFELVWHVPGGRVEWIHNLVTTTLFPGQDGPDGISGHQMLEELRKSPMCALNACHRDFLEDNPDQIPRSFWGYHVLFPGTHFQGNGTEEVFIPQLSVDEDGVGTASLRKLDERWKVRALTAIYAER